MNLRQMEVFRAVMLTGTVAAAADLLHVSQPSVSKALALGERRSGLKLFERVKGRLLPTPEAKRLYQEVDKLWFGVEKIRSLSAELASAEHASIHIASSPSLGAALIPRAATALYEQVPGAKVRVDLLVPHLLVDAIAQHSVDVGLSLFPLDHPNIAKIEQFRCGLVCVMPKGHALSGRKTVAPRDLLGYRVISFPPEAAYGMAPEAVFGSVMDRLHFGLEVRAGQSACLFSAAGAGVAVVDELTVMGNAFPHLEVRPFKTPAKLTVTVAHHAHTPLSVMAKRFIGVLSKTLGTG